MKTNLFLIFKYWKAHKGQFAAVIFSAAFLAAIVLLAGLIGRTELRRTYEFYLYEFGKQSHTYFDISDEIYDEMRSDERVDDIGQILVWGKIGNGSYEYTYGAYLDDSARRLENLDVIAGHMPEKTGEIALYEHAAADLLFSAEADDCIGKTVTLKKYASGASEAEKENSLFEAYTVTGVIRKTYHRERDYLEFYTGVTPSLPSVYLYKDDCAETQNTHKYTLVYAKGYDRIWDEGKEDWSQSTYLDYLKKYDPFAVHYYEEYGISSSTSYGDGNGIWKTLRNTMINTTHSTMNVHQSETTVVIRYFSFIAAIISGISLFGVLCTVMKKRIKSLYLIRRIGCSEKRVIIIVVTEAVLLMLFGIICGLIFGTALYELILFIQKNFMGLSPLTAFDCEWAVKRVSSNPFFTAVISSSSVFITGYVIYYLQRKFFGKRRLLKNRKVRPLYRIKSALCGLPFSNIMQMLSVAFVLTSVTLCFAFFTDKGKGEDITYFFKNYENSAENFYSCCGINMREAGVDVCVYTNSAGDGAISVTNDNGITEEALREMEGSYENGHVYSFSVNTAFSIYYPKDSDDVPVKIKERWVGELVDSANPVFKKDERNYYLTGITSANDAGMEWLGKYIREGDIGKYENGITLVIYAEDRMAPFPYKAGDRVNFFAADVRELTVDQLVDTEFVFDLPTSDKEAIIEAVVFIPAEARTEEPVLYDNFRSTLFAASYSTVKHLETFRYSFNKTFITFPENTDFKSALSRLQDLLDSSMKVNLRTIKQCDAEYIQNRLERGSSIALLFASFIIMSATGYCSIISARLDNSLKSAAIMRTLGMSRRSWNITFILRNILNCFCACVLGAAMVYGVQWLLSEKYNECINDIGWAETLSTLSATDEQLSRAYSIGNAYLLEREIQNVPMLPIIVIFSIILMLSSTAVTVIFLQRNARREKLTEIIASKE